MKQISDKMGNIKNHIMKSDELPLLDNEIKEAVNMGILILYTIKKSNIPESKFLIKSNNNSLILKNNGEFLKLREDEDILLDSIIYFSDLDRPQSASNLIKNGIIS